MENLKELKNLKKKSIKELWLVWIIDAIITVVVTYTILGLLAWWLCTISAEKSYTWYNGLWHGLNLQGNMVRSLVSSNEILWMAPDNNVTDSYSYGFWFFGVGGVIAIIKSLFSIIAALMGKRKISNEMMVKAVLCAAWTDGDLAEKEKDFLCSLSYRVFGLNKDRWDFICEQVKNGDTGYAILDSQVPELIENIAKMIAADGTITQDEEDLIYLVAEQNDFSKEETEKLIKKYLKE